MAFKNVIDPEQARRSLEAWLPTRLPVPDELAVSDVAVSQSSGMSCETVLFDVAYRADGVARRHRLVARVAPPPGDDGLRLFPTYDLELEAAIMRAVDAATAVPVPRVLLVETDPAVLGGPFLVMERVEGRVPPDDPPFTRGGWVLDLEPAEQERLVDGAIGVLAGLHGADPSTLGVDALDRPERGARGIEQYIGTAEHLYRDAAAGRPHATLDAAFARIREQRPAEEGPAVLNWGDARFGNLVFDDDLTVAAVLDWEMAGLGPREIDLGFLLATLDFFTRGYGAPWPSGFPPEAEIVARYEARTGHQVRDLAYFKALTMLMTAVILMRVGHVLIANGQLPPDSPFPVANPASILLAEYLGLPAPSGETVDWLASR